MTKINAASTHLCPSFSLRSRQSTCDPPPYFLFLTPSSLSFWVYATATSPPIMPLLSFPTHTPFSLRSLFIHSYFTASTATHKSRSIALELFLIIISPSLSAFICIPLAFLPLGILLLSLPLSPCTPPSLSLSL